MAQPAESEPAVGSAADHQRIELALALLLRAGVLLAAGLVLVGGLMYLVRDHDLLPTG